MNGTKQRRKRKTPGMRYSLAFDDGLEQPLNTMSPLTDSTVDPKRVSPSRARIPDDVLAEHFYEALQEAFAELQEKRREQEDELGINQEIIAERLGKNPSQISRQLRGGANLTLRTLSDIARALEGRVRINIQLFKDLPRANYYYEYPVEKAITTSDKPNLQLREIVQSFAIGNPTTKLLTR